MWWSSWSWLLQYFSSTFCFEMYQSVKLWLWPKSDMSLVFLDSLHFGIQRDNNSILWTCVIILTGSPSDFRTSHDQLLCGQARTSCCPCLYVFVDSFSSSLVESTLVSGEDQSDRQYLHMEIINDVSLRLKILSQGFRFMILRDVSKTSSSSYAPSVMWHERTVRHVLTWRSHKIRHSHPSERQTSLQLTRRESRSLRP